MSRLGEKIRHLAVRLRNVHMFMSREIDDLAAQADRAIDGDKQREEMTLRRLLWLRHDSEHSGILYGDDGEMQCAACRIDFRRDRPAEIERMFMEAGIRHLTDAHTKETTRE